MPESPTDVAPPFDPIVAYGIGGLAVLVGAAWVMLLAGGSRRRLLLLGAGAALVMAASAFLALSGTLARFDLRPPPMALMVLSVLVLSVVIAWSPAGRSAAAGVSFAALIGLQGFRLPLELVMHRAAEVGIMPVALSYSGYNLDIVTGAAAFLLYAARLSRGPVPRSVLWAFNVWGLWCLLVILVIAVATSPMVRALGDDPRNLNTWVLHFPYVWLPVVLVTTALSGHLVLTRKLMARP